jgi:hypothetical protein
MILGVIAKNAGLALGAKGLKVLFSQGIHSFLIKIPDP